MTKNSIAAWGAALALLAGPALAVADPPSGKGKSGDDAAQTTPAATTPDKPVGPSASNKAKGKAYGRYCADASKKKAEGQKKSPFAECVNAMAKLKSGEKKTAKAACKGLSKKKVAGQKKTAYAACISAAAKLKGDEAPAPTTPEATPTPSPAPEATPAPTPAPTTP